MNHEDQRADDRGRGARGLAVKDWLQLVAIVLASGGLLWQGGRQTEKLDTVVVTVNTIRDQVSSQQVDQATVKARLDGHDKEIANHEMRIVRIENRRER